MVEIKSKLTGLTQTIPQEEWQGMKDRGLGRKFDLIRANAKPLKAAPPELAGVDHARLVQAGKDAFADEVYVVAKEEFQKAAKIKETPYIKGMLTKIENKLA